MGSVFLARDTRLGRLVAIKFLNVHNPELNARFIAEAQTTAQCNHENIVVLYEADEHDGQPYMVLEYLEGKALDRIVDESRSAQRAASSDGEDTDGLIMPVARVVELMVPVLKALERAHSMGIVHRDLKPANVLLTDNGTVKVLDFGIAKVLADGGASAGAQALATEGDGGAPIAKTPAKTPVATISTSSMVKTRGMAGTLPYMAPEQILSGHIDGRTDIWALGIMLYEMSTGEHPLAPVTLKKLDTVADLSTPMPRVSEMRPELGKLGAIIDRCLIKTAQDRTASARELLEELEPLMPRHGGAHLGADESPFTGLSAFQEADADRFFGRSDDIANLVAKVRNQPLVAVIGPSGVGKSSLVRAGVVPALKRSGEGWESLIVRPGRKPMAALSDLLQQLNKRQTTTTFGGTRSGAGGQLAAKHRDDDASLSEWQAMESKLGQEPGLLGTELRAWAQRKLRRLLIFIDQFEEIYTANPDQDERAIFLACIASIADDATSPLRVMLSMRSDFLERMAHDRAFMAAATRGLVFLSPMDRAGLREALEKPLDSVGYRFENPSVVDAMLDELESTPGALPLMQFTASHLWEDRDRGRKLLTEASYEAMGGIAGTLARHADHVLAGMPASQVRVARGIFERLVTPERTRAIASMSELMALPGGIEDIQDVLQTLADARLLVIESSDVDRASMSMAGGMADNSAVEIVHESLIDRWPTLRRWLDENQDDAQFLARLRTAAKQWHKSGRAAGMLWRGDVAREAEGWFERYQGKLPEQEQQFLQAVFTADKRSARRKRRIIFAVSAAAVLLALVGAVAVTQSRQVGLINAQKQELSDSKLRLEELLFKEEELRSQAEHARQTAERARDETAERERDAQRARLDAERQRQKAEEQTLEAERARTEAEEQRRLAETRQREAEAAQKQAIATLRRAEKAEELAEQARKLAEDRQKELQRIMDRHGIKKLELEGN